jgi:hypothetical protein
MSSRRKLGCRREWKGLRKSMRGAVDRLPRLCMCVNFRSCTLGYRLTIRKGDHEQTRRSRLGARGYAPLWIGTPAPLCNLTAFVLETHGSKSKASRGCGTGDGSGLRLQETSTPNARGTARSTSKKAFRERLGTACFGGRGKSERCGQRSLPSIWSLPGPPGPRRGARLGRGRESTRRSAGRSGGRT